MNARINGQQDNYTRQKQESSAMGNCPVKNRNAIEVVYRETSGPLAEQFIAGRGTAGCFIGLSVRNRMTNRRSLRLLLPWVIRRARMNSMPLRIIVGDYLSRHNLMALNGYEPKKAELKAMKLGDRPRRYACEIVRELGVEREVIVQSCNELVRSTHCVAIISVLNAYAESNSCFADSLADEARTFLSGIRANRQIDDDEVMIHRLIDYVVEETAMFLLLYKIGYRIEVYPGSDLRIMRLIATGTFPRFPYSCPERTHIAVQLPLSEYSNMDGGR